MAKRASSPLTFQQITFLVLLVPAVMLGVLEVCARLVLLPKSEPAVSAPTALEMPTWMLNDANAIARRPPSSDAIDWLNLFREGQNFRVHLIPHIEKAVFNTFSLIPADRELKYLVKANSLGFRGPELTQSKPADTFRILIFGDSSSFGWGVNAEDSWSVLLGESLQKSYPTKRIEVGNFAIPGDSSAYGKLLFDTFAPQFESDLVILGFGANDAKLVFTSHSDQVERFSGKKDLLTIASWLRLSALYRLLESIATPKASKPPSPLNRTKVHAVTAQAYTENLKAMGTRARDLGNKNTLLLSLCTPEDYARKGRALARQESFLWFNGQNQLIKAVPRLQKGEIYPEYVERMRSLYPEALERNKLFYITSDGCHPNQLGHRFVADNLSRIISESGVLN